MNRRGVEGLPLKYVIMAIIAALVVGTLIQVTGELNSGIENATGMFVTTLNESVSGLTK